jgi:hypothetical protein
MPIRWTNSDSYTSEMIRPRTVPLFDPDAQPASWNERMSHGEYAVHYSSFDQVAREIGPSCTVLGSLEGAEEYAKAQVMLNPELRCRIYDDRGFVDRPSSKSADSDTKERVKSHHVSAQMVRIAAIFRWARIGHRGLELGLQAHMVRNDRRTHAYSGPYPARNRTSLDTSCQAKAYPR